MKLDYFNINELNKIINFIEINLEHKFIYYHTSSTLIIFSCKKKCESSILLVKLITNNINFYRIRLYKSTENTNYYTLQ